MVLREEKQTKRGQKMLKSIEQFYYYTVDINQTQPFLRKDFDLGWKRQVK